MLLKILCFTLFWHGSLTLDIEIDCNAVTCTKLECEDGFEPETIPGFCCPMCPIMDCSDMICEELKCGLNQQSNTPFGECCPVCQDCSAVSCLLPKCSRNEQLFTPPGKCCPECQDCSAVTCLMPSCNKNQATVTPPGKCCPECQDQCIDDQGVKHREGSKWQVNPCEGCECDNGEIICYIIDCLPVTCKNPITPPGACCAVCPKKPTQCKVGNKVGECKPEILCKKPSQCRYPCRAGKCGQNMVCCFDKKNKPAKKQCQVKEKPGKCPSKPLASCRVENRCNLDQDCQGNNKCCYGCCTSAGLTECKYMDVKKGKTYVGLYTPPDACNKPNKACPGIPCPLPGKKCVCCFGKKDAPPREICKSGKKASPKQKCVIKVGKKAFNGICTQPSKCKKGNKYSVSCPLNKDCSANQVCCFKDKKKPPPPFCNLKG